MLKIYPNLIPEEEEKSYKYLKRISILCSISLLFNFYVRSHFSQGNACSTVNIIFVHTYSKPLLLEIVVVVFIATSRTPMFGQLPTRLSGSFRINIISVFAYKKRRSRILQRVVFNILLSVVFKGQWPDIIAPHVVYIQTYYVYTCMYMYVHVRRQTGTASLMI